MQYSSFIGDHIPCRFKSLIEDSSLRQLQFVGDDRQKIKPEFIAEFRNKTTITGKDKFSEGKSQREEKLIIGKDEEQSKKGLSLREIFHMICSGGKFTRAFRGWKLCPRLHSKPVLYGLPDDPNHRARHTNSLYLSSIDVDFPQFISRSARSMNLQSNSENAPSSNLSSKSGPASFVANSSTTIGNTGTNSNKSATKVTSYHGTPGTLQDFQNTASRTKFLISQTVRPSSSNYIASTEEQDSILPTDQPIHPMRSSSEHNSSIGDAVEIDLNYLENQEVEAYMGNYRGGYTYRKVCEQQSLSGNTRSASTPTSCNECTPPPPKPNSKVQHRELSSNVGKRISSGSSKCPSNNNGPSVILGSTSSRANNHGSKVMTKYVKNNFNSVVTNATQSKMGGGIMKRLTASAKENERRKKGVSRQCLWGTSGKMTKECYEELKHQQITWQMNQRFHEICDPRLTINNPSPNEVAVFCRIPQMVHKSSPSIPSNRNGKYGGKSKDQPYPFDLNISAASCPVQADSKTHTKSIFDFV